MATGEYIALVDSDDYVDIHTYETAYNLAKKDNVDILNFKARAFDDGKDDHINKIDFSDGKVISAEEYVQNNLKFWCWDNLYKKELIQNDNIRFMPDIKPADDTCFAYMALGKAKRIKSIPATFYNYRERSDSLSRISYEKVADGSHKIFNYVTNSWRFRDCLKNNEHNLLTLLFRWAGCFDGEFLKYARKMLGYLGNDVYNPEIISKCPDYIQKEIKKFEYSIQTNKNPPLEDGIYRIASALGDHTKRLDIAGGSTQNCANLQLWEVNENIAQDFEIVKQKRGCYTIKALCSGRMLDVENGSQEAGGNIRQHDSNNLPPQYWYILPCEDGTFNIISVCNLLALDVENGNEQNGTNIRCWHRNTSNSQKFKFIKPRPCSNNKKISIAMATDRNYAYPTIVSMTSILENKNSDTEINFYLMLSGDFDKSLKNKILSLQKKYSNCKITPIDMGNRLNSLYLSRHLTKAAYYRLLLSSLLPNLDKVLYMDVDTITKHDLCKLFNYNIDKFYVAGVLDGIVPFGNDKYTLQQYVSFSRGYNSYEEVLNIPDMDQYINSGIVLFNLKNMRNDGIENEFMKASQENNFEWYDQDVLNAVCYGRIKFLPLKYNAIIHYFINGNQVLHSVNQVNEAKNDPVIIHYTYPKPWKNLNSISHPWYPLWWEYAEKTDYFKEIQDKFLFKDNICFKNGNNIYFKDGIYNIVSALNNNKSWDIPGGLSKNCIPLQLFDKNGTNAQKFEIKYVGDRCYNIRPLCSDKVLNVEYAKKENGAVISLYYNFGTDAQKWYFLPAENGYFKIVSRCNNLVVDVNGAQTKNGTPIRCWSQNNTAAQRFKLLNVG